VSGLSNARRIRSRRRADSAGVQPHAREYSE
jgi:hypothetical protein